MSLREIVIYPVEAHGRASDDNKIRAAHNRATLILLRL